MKLPIALLLVLLSVATSGTVLTANPQGCIDSTAYDADTDFFPDKFVPDETTDLFTITYHNTYKIITNKFSEKSYLLYQCGTTPPENEVKYGWHHLVLPVPHTGGVAISETVQIPPMEVLGKRSEIKAYIGNPQYISSPCLNYLLSDEAEDEEAVETIYYPEDPWNTTLSDEGTSDFLSRNPDAIVLTGPLGNVNADRAWGDASTQEKTNVATFDWLGMYAALFNLEGKANEIIAETKARYQCLADNAAAVESDINEDDKPKVLWAEYFDGIGWSIGECPTWDAAYYCEYAQHCGASIISRPEGVGFSESYGTDVLYWYLTDDEFLELGKDAETWIYPSKTFNDVYSQKKDMLDQFKSVQNQNVYDTQGSGPLAWFEQRLAEYDVVAMDMCTLVGTANPTSIHVRQWFRNYFTESIGTQGTCNVPEDITMAHVPEQAECTPLQSGGSSGFPPEGSAAATNSSPRSNTVFSLASVLAIFAGISTLFT